MVYGSSLTVPGTFVENGGEPEASVHLQRMRDIAGRLVPAPDVWHGTKPAKPCARLSEAEFVFVRRDATHGPLQKPYTGPYRVLERREKFYKLQCGEREESVSVDRLKPAYSDPVDPIQPAVPPKRGRPPKRKDAQASAGGQEQERTSTANYDSAGPRAHRRWRRADSSRAEVNGADVRASHEEWKTESTTPEIWGYIGCRRWGGVLWRVPRESLRESQESYFASAR